MSLYIVETKEDMSRLAYQIILETILTKDKATLGLATGSTPEGIYDYFVNDKPDLSHVTTVNLDEYIGLSPTDEQSYAYYMKTKLFDHVNFNASYLPDGTNLDHASECARYDEILANFTPDLQLLGIGTNGHIAFNEPGTSPELTTHVAQLTNETIASNARFFNSIDEVPTLAYTMGIKSIMSAKKVLLVADGEAKAQAIKDLVEGEISEEIPASILKTHPDITVIVDKLAASKLDLDLSRKSGCCGGGGGCGCSGHGEEENSGGCCGGGCH